MQAVPGVPGIPIDPVDNEYMSVTRRAFLSTSTAACLAQSIETATLSNAFLDVEFLPGRPAVESYLHKPSGMRIGAAEPDGTLMVNRVSIPWRDWEIHLDRESQGHLRYRLALKNPEISLQFDYALQDYVLALEVAVTADPANALKKLDWHNLPLLTCADPDITLWREVWKQRDWNLKVGRGLWTSTLSEKRLADSAAEPSSPTVYSCFYKPNAVCCTALSNVRYLPLRNQVSASAPNAKRYALSLNEYQPRAHRQWLEPLRVKVAFLPDLNGDGRADASDFQLWVNRQLPLPLPTHRHAIWYKIYCGAGPLRSTFPQAGEIIERVHRYTDGLPQIAYLVGWQYQGHDTGYPSLDQVNPAAGTRDDLLRLHREARERWNAAVSYHINLDDSYKSHPGWDESVIAREPDGSLMRWEVFNNELSYHTSHTKDVESGKVFQRLEAMMRTVPVDTAIHIDAFRNMNWSWEPDGFIGPVEELECGVKPIVQFFKSHGIDVTTESVDPDAAEWCGIVSGVYHLATPAAMVQLRHGKMLGGGRGGKRDLWRWGLGSSTDDDIAYSNAGQDYIASGEWNRFLDDIYLGALLLHYYVDREMTVLRIDSRAAHLKFGDGVTAVVGKDGSSLLVKDGDVVVARDYDRFIPRGASIYAYSRDGSSNKWLLPPAFRGRALLVRTLGDGSQPREVPPADTIALDLKPRTPVKIIAKT